MSHATWETWVPPVSTSPCCGSGHKKTPNLTVSFLIPNSQGRLLWSNCVLEDGIMQNMASGIVHPCGQLRGILNWTHIPKGAQYVHMHIHTHKHTRTCMFMGGKKWKDIYQRVQICGSWAKPTFYNWEILQYEN